ncbi:hypothetical protein [Priestia megaterium]|uniref:hypothetical protein n=1 Tax=Priestia megaterium TaxID=1404 RepID=UPI0015D49CD9|nr:hypothetical protein [Priestia megaterium]
MNKEFKEFKTYSKEHLNYARMIQSRNLKFQMNDERYYKLRRKLQEWLDYSIKKGREE